MSRPEDFLPQSAAREPCAGQPATAQSADWKRAPRQVTPLGCAFGRGRVISDSRGGSKRAKLRLATGAGRSRSLTKLNRGLPAKSISPRAKASRPRDRSAT